MKSEAKLKAMVDAAAEAEEERILRGKVATPPKLKSMRI